MAKICKRLYEKEKEFVGAKIANKKVYF